jgi:predicted transcriptional regulator
VLASYHILWYSVNMAQKKTSIRLSDTAQTLLQRLAESLGISQSAVIEQAIRTLAKKEGISVERGERTHD